MSELNDQRRAIERIDRRIIRLVSKRLEATCRVARFKRDHPVAPLRDEGREREVLGYWKEEGRKAGLSPYFLGRILREILRYSRREQERLLGPAEEAPEPARGVRVGFQGARGAYSELAARKLFELRRVEGLLTRGYHSIQETLDALGASEVDYVLLPIENTIAGSINEVYELLSERPFHVVDEEVWRVEHCLAGLPGARLEDLRAIRSHPIALQQCAGILAELSTATTVSWFDTAGAAESVAKEGNPETAALCSLEAARCAGLEILRANVSDTPDNQTRFLLISRTPEIMDPRVPARTSLFLTLNDRPGALAECLQALHAQGVNLTKLESRPKRGAPWEYQFYLDIEGSFSHENVSRALVELRSHTNFLRVFGSYPRRVGEEASGEPMLPAAERPDGTPAVDGEARAVAATPAPVLPGCELVNLSEDHGRSSFRVGSVLVGPGTFTLIAGPCAVESRAQILDSAEMVKALGADMLRGGAFKPRTSPYAFQGLGLKGLELLAEAGRRFELPVVTEVVHPEDVAAVAERADVIQVGARSMQNFALLRELGSLQTPVLLKRGMSATIRELLQAAEYILAGGNGQVILCERGIRTFETSTRSTLDLSAVPVLKELTHLPVIVDPSHAAGRRELVVPLALAAAAVGADGIIVECHPRPKEALCDKDQALTGADLEELVRRIGPLIQARSPGRRSSSTSA